MRQSLKSLAELVLLAGGPAAAGRIRMRGRTLVLAYHNIVPDDAAPAGERSLHVRRSDFAGQMDLLVRSADVVPLSAALGEPVRRGGRPRVAITFDDAYAGAVHEGLAVLAARGLPATIFVAPAFLDGRSFWWDALAEAHGGVVPPDVRAHALQELRGDDAAVRAHHPATERADRRLPAHARSVAGAYLLKMTETPGIELASHTWGHRNLCALDATAREAELRRPLEWLRDLVGATPPVLAYPYGLHDAHVQRAAREAGYRTALRVDGGWITPRSDPHALPRFNVPAGLSARGFALRLAGLLAA